MACYKVEICGVNTAKLPILTNQQKEELFDRIGNGDKAAREEFINGNLRLVPGKTWTTCSRLAVSD